MSAKKNPTRILIVDDHPLLRKGISQMINAEKDLATCGEAEDARNALSTITATKPDLVVCDVSLKDSSGIELLKNIKAMYPKLHVLILSMHEESVYAQRALRAGASGYLMKQEATEKVLIAIRQVLAGQVYLSERMGAHLLNRLVGGRASITASPVELLSDRELEVFGMIGRGFGTRPIAQKLNLSIKTIESHRAHIKEKLNLSNAAELVHQAIQWAQSESIG